MTEADCRRLVMSLSVHTGWTLSEIMVMDGGEAYQWYQTLADVLRASHPG